MPTTSSFTPRSARRAVVGLPAVALLLLAAACGGGGGSPGAQATGTTLGSSTVCEAPPKVPAVAPAALNGAKLKVVTSVAPLTNIARNMLGDKVALQGVIPEGVDSHTFEPQPQTAQILAGANLVFLDGLHLEDPTRKLAEANKAPDGDIVLMGEATISEDQYQYDFTFPKDKGDPNPHLWMNPICARDFAKVIADVTSAKDPANKDFYQANYRAFSAKIDSLDKAIAASISSVPEQQRKLLTYHDSFAYFSARYRIPVIGAVQPSDFSEPSPQDIARLIDQVKAEHVPAIFGSEVFPSKVLEQVAKESGAKYVDKLRDDELPGDSTAPDHTYIGLMVSDVVAITDALGGSSAPMRAVDAANVA
jgi:manganese/iron transport system substrate-binding protein